MELSIRIGTDLCLEIISRPTKPMHIQSDIYQDSHHLLSVETSTYSELVHRTTLRRKHKIEWFLFPSQFIGHKIESPHSINTPNSLIDSAFRHFVTSFQAYLLHQKFFLFILDTDNIHISQSNWFLIDIDSRTIDQNLPVISNTILQSQQLRRDLQCSLIPSGHDSVNTGRIKTEHIVL